jgi:hypothetical protein
VYCSVFLSGSEGGFLQFQPGANSFSPLGMVPVASTVLYRKKKLASSYEVTPDWLVLGVTDQRGDFSASVSYLKSIAPEIEPFKRVMTYHAGDIVDWKQESVTKTA